MSSNNDIKLSINDEKNDSVRKKINVYRYKFSDEVVKKIGEFAKIHQFDDRHTYKENWAEWLEENEDMVQEETERMRNLGYDKDVEDKMFKSGRYYFRKKNSDTPKPVKRRDYITIEYTLLTAMDDHIKNNMNKDDYTPAKGYDSFCEDSEEILLREITQLMKTNMIDAQDLANKIKKTYKNRYFIISRS